MVEGTEDYEVDIEMEDGRICEMYCTCPYADDGNNCKHMAAVLYEIEEQEEAGNLAEGAGPDQTEEALEEIIEKIPEEELRSFVKQLAGQDDGIRNTLMTRYAVRIDEKQMQRLKQGVDQIVWEHGGTSQVANTCYDKWKEILDNCTEEVRAEMFTWFTSHLSCDYVIDYMEEYMEDFLAHEFRSREMLEKKLEYLDEMIERQSDSTDCGATWSARYGFENNILKRLEIMNQLDYPEEGIGEYRRKH